ncbi:hypothetical protein DAEQUDRAFT_381426 [Daedalea quercina L-15889]|uniref:Ribonuclease H1 N-terminal domain-containing protein n=1 Tax=Daedalea quercina L-15889 TaxID=1314783 RepID=A0A165NZV4_9APHY|nr:hypothetical protein DAEQUDRAFT_381426 [Daedalea quercina L-15889]
MVSGVEVSSAVSRLTEKYICTCWSRFDSETLDQRRHVSLHDTRSERVHRAIRSGSRHHPRTSGLKHVPRLFFKQSPITLLNAESNKTSVLCCQKRQGRSSRLLVLGRGQSQRLLMYITRYIMQSDLYTQVVGSPGAIHKSFPTQAEAEMFMNGASGSRHTYIQDLPPDPESLRELPDISGDRQVSSTRYCRWTARKM